MIFTSTRDTSVKVEASFAIANGISKDGGLFVPETFPVLTESDILKLQQLTYEERAAVIISAFLTDYTYDEILECAKKAYERFEGDPAPLVKVDETTFMLELWHGPTCAFKDMALTILPHLMTLAKKKQGIKENIEILVATSGDTGKAALEGFKDVEGTHITVFYPSDGVSDVQKMQMTTQEGKNVFVASVNGNFDDCQTAVKTIFTDKKFNEDLKKNNVVFSSANSINWGRLVPQIVYYFSAYVDMLDSKEIKFGDKVNFCVPTGNFGNILAGFYAKKMGLPIGKLLCASNSNNILTDFFDSGEYDTNREFFKTISPSMDILISSNLERLLFEISGRNSEITTQRMNELKEKGVYAITEKEHKVICENFYAGYSMEEETIDAINYMFEELDYVVDPHTAVAVDVYNEWLSSFGEGDTTPTVVVSTASPYKFADDVLFALSRKREKNAFDSVSKLESLTGLEVPQSLAGLKDKKVVFNEVFDKNNLVQIMRDRLIK